MVLWSQEIGDNSLLKYLRQPPLSGPLRVRSFRWDWRAFSRALAVASKTGNAGDLPDVIELGSSWTSDLVRAGLLLDVTDLGRTLHAAHSFFPHALATCSDHLQSGCLRAIPILLDVRVLFYHSSLIDRYLGAHPNAFRSWDAFSDLCLEAAHDLGRGVLGFTHGRDGALHELLPWVHAAGGALLARSGHVTVNSVSVRRAFKFLAGLTMSGYGQLPGLDITESVSKVRIEFSARRFAFMTGGYWLTHVGGEELTAVNHPPDVKRANSVIGGTHLGIVAKYGQDPHRPEYAEPKAFVAALTSAENELVLGQLFGKIPANIAAWQMCLDHSSIYGEVCARCGNKPARRETLLAFEEALRYNDSSALPTVLKFGEVEDALKDVVARLWTTVGETDSTVAPPNEAVQRCFEKVEALLSAAQDDLSFVLTGYTDRFSMAEVKARGLRPPGDYDLWLSVNEGKVYQKGSVAPIQGASADLLFAYALAPGRRRSESELLADKNLWGRDMTTNVSDRSSGHERLYKRHQRLRKAIGEQKLLLIGNDYGIRKDLRVCIVVD